MNNQNAKINMISQQLRTSDVLNESILALYASLDRKAFLPSAYQDFGYSDMQIPLDAHNRLMTPAEEGKVLQALSIMPQDTVLEVGTGSGFFTALLSKLARKVITLDIDADRQHHAKTLLDARQCHNVDYITADGSDGYMNKAPYDVIVVTGGLTSITQSLRSQLAPNGRIFAIVGQSPAMQGVLLHLTDDRVWHKSVLFETEMPYLKTASAKEAFIF